MVQTRSQARGEHRAEVPLPRLSRRMSIPATSSVGKLRKQKQRAISQGNAGTESSELEGGQDFAVLYLWTDPSTNDIVKSRRGEQLTTSPSSGYVLTKADYYAVVKHLATSKAIPSPSQLHEADKSLAIADPAAGPALGKTTTIASASPRLTQSKVDTSRFSETLIAVAPNPPTAPQSDRSRKRNAEEEDELSSSATKRPRHEEARPVSPSWNQKRRSPYTWGLASILGRLTGGAVGIRRQWQRSRERSRSSMSVVEKKTTAEERQAKEGQEKAKAEELDKDIDRKVVRRLNKALEEQHQVTKLDVAGKKRKRDDPIVIPNPRGSSYGMDPDFFIIESSDDEEGIKESDEDPSSRRAEKKPRVDTDTSHPLESLIGKFHSTPYIAPVNTFTVPDLSEDESPSATVFPPPVVLVASAPAAVEVDTIPATTAKSPPVATVTSDEARPSELSTESLHLEDNEPCMSHDSHTQSPPKDSGPFGRRINPRNRRLRQN